MSDTLNLIQFLPTTHLQPNPLQPRGSVDETELAELVDSIRIHGILEPLVVAHTPAGYQIIAGERRWLASKKAGLTEVPCVIKETSPKGMLEMAIIENVQRVDLHPLDRARAFQRLLEEFRLTVGQIAERVGKSQAYVSNSLRLLTLPDAIKDGLLSGAISEGHARALAAIDDIHLMVEAYKILLKESGSVRRAEELARRMKQKSGQPAKGLGTAPIFVSPQLDTWQDQLQEYFGKAAKVKLQQSRSQTKVSFVFKGNPNEVQHMLDRVLELTAAPLPEPKSGTPSITLDAFNTTEIVIGE
ncbi:MAG: ParB/RepB/Spo0J family partition protein [Candidatus Woesebacteria bacterium]